MKKNGRIYTVDDLLHFCESNKFMNFSSKQYGSPLLISTPAVFEKNDDDKDPYTLYARCLVMHTSTNRNHCKVTEAAAKKAMEGLAYKPVLANFCEIDGVRDFTSHDFSVDEDGNCIYYEHQIGCFTADKPTLEESDDMDKERKDVWATVAIPREYTDAAEIIERKNGTKVSVELNINEFQYDVHNNELILSDIDIMGLTCLGVDPDTGREIQEGMKGASIKLEDFSATNYSLTVDNIADAVISRLEGKILIANNKGKEDGGMRKKKNFNDEDMKTFGDNAGADSGIGGEANGENGSGDSTCGDSGISNGDSGTSGGSGGDDGTGSDTGVDNGSSGIFSGDDDPDGGNEGTGGDEGSGSGDNAGDDENGGTGADSGSDDGDDDEGEGSHNRDTDEVDPKKRKYTVNGKTFEVSMDEVISALYTLVNDTYSENDNEYYSVKVYESSKTLVMIGYWTDKCYRQSYKVRNNVYSLVGDRVAVKAIYVTADEEAELDKIRSNYSAISNKLEMYEAEPEKMKLLESEDYSNLSGVKEFEELKDVKNHFEMSVDELRGKCDKLLLDFAKTNNIKEKSAKPNVGRKSFGFARTNNVHKKKYGNLFN